MMKFHALLSTSRQLERPLDIYGNDLSGMIKWAKAVLKTCPPGETIQIFETLEVLTRIVQKEDLEVQKVQ